MNYKDKLLIALLAFAFVLAGCLFWLIETAKDIQPPFPYKYTCSGTTLNYSDYDMATGQGGNNIVSDSPICKEG